MSARWGYQVSPRAAKDLQRLDQQVRERIFEALDRFVADPSQGNKRKLKGKPNEWRLRVGDWRVRYRPDLLRRLIVVERVGPRGSVYRD